MCWTAELAPRKPPRRRGSTLEVLADRRFRRRNPGYVEGQPCVYVGMTGLAVAERFRNHKRGHKGNVFVLRFGTRVLPELFAHLNPMP